MKTRVIALALVVVITLLISTPLIVNSFFNYSEVRSTVIYAPAVSSSGSGVLSRIELYVAYPGGGKVFFSSLPYTEVETQGAARIAAFIASLVAGVDFSKYDYYVVMESQVPLVGGPSAGGLITVGFASLLLNVTIRPDVTMTGMINPDGTIGYVGGLKEKLEAAASSGFKVFLVPAGQRYYTYPVYVEERRGPLVIGRLRYETIDLVEYGKNLGVNVYEVSNILDALYYFTGVNITKPGEFPPLRNMEVIKNFASSLLQETQNILVDATNTASKTGFYRMQLLQYIRSLNNTVSTVKSLLEKYPVYSTYTLIDVYSNALNVAWLASYLNSGALDNVFKYVNSTLDTYLSRLSNAGLSLRESLMQAYVFISWLYYLKASNESSVETVIDYLASASKYLKLVDFIDMSVSEDLLLNNSYEESIIVYSHALASYTYASRVIEQMGVTVSGDTTGDVLTVLDYASSENKTSVYALSALVLTGSARVIHQAIGDLNNVSYKLYPLIQTLGGSVESDAILLYIELAREASELGDTGVYTDALLTTMGLLQVVRSVYSVSTAISRSVSNTITQIPPGGNTTTTTTMTTVLENSSTTRGNTQLSNIEVLLILSVVLAVILAFTIAYIIHSFSAISKTSHTSMFKILNKC